MPAWPILRLSSSTIDCGQSSSSAAALLTVQPRLETLVARPPRDVADRCFAGMHGTLAIRESFEDCYECCDQHCAACGILSSSNLQAH